MKRFNLFWDYLLNKKISRKNFIKSLIALLTSFTFANSFVKEIFAFTKADSSYGRKKKGIKGKYDLVLTRGDNPYRIIVKAVQLMGGMEKFVKKNSVVLIKPNIAWDRAPELAVNTNPEVVAALIDLCFQAGARKVNIFDNSCNEVRRCYLNSGIQSVVKEHGADMLLPISWNVVAAKFNYESPLENWPIFQDALECDTFINVPILKHHHLTELTLSMKNLMGICGGNRGSMHFNIGRKLVDLTDFINPELTIIDAVRVLLRHGPVGGSLNDVLEMKTVIVGTDPALTDTFACSLMKKDPFSIPYIREARERHFGNTDLEKASIIQVDV